MSNARRNVPRILATAFTLVMLATPSLASDPPDSLINPRSRYIEVVDSPVGVGSTEIRHTIDRGKLGPKEVFWVSTDAANDFSPRIAISPAGDSSVVWWRDSAPRAVFARKRNDASGTWAATRQLSEVGENAANPEIVHDGSSAWVAFEIAGSGETSIGVSVITDEPDPILPRAIVASTGYAGHADVMIHHEPSKLWVSWIDSGSEVGWSVYHYASGTWSALAYQSYSGSDVAAARQAIRTVVTGGAP